MGNRRRPQIVGEKRDRAGVIDGFVPQTHEPGADAYADSDALTRSVDQYLGLLWAFISVMLVLGGMLAFAVIYVTMAVNVVERTNELATLRNCEPRGYVSAGSPRLS